MTNLVITSTDNSIRVNFNDTPLGNVMQGTWRKDHIEAFRQLSDRIVVITFDGMFEVAHVETTGALVIDSVDGVAPSGLTDLYTKLSALIA